MRILALIALALSVGRSQGVSSWEQAVISKIGNCELGAITKSPGYERSSYVCGDLAMAITKDSRLKRPETELLVGGLPSQSYADELVDLVKFKLGGCKPLPKKHSKTLFLCGEKNNQWELGIADVTKHKIVTISLTVSPALPPRVVESRG